MYASSLSWVGSYSRIPICNASVYHLTRDRLTVATYKHLSNDTTKVGR